MGHKKNIFSDTGINILAKFLDLGWAEGLISVDVWCDYYKFEKY